MPERSEAEIHLKTTGDDSGILKLRAEIKKLKEELAKPAPPGPVVSPAMAALQSGHTKEDIDKIRKEERDKQQIDDEFYRNKAKERVAAQREALKEEGQLYQERGKQARQYERLEKEQTAKPIVSPAMAALQGARDKTQAGGLGLPDLGEKGELDPAIQGRLYDTRRKQETQAERLKKAEDYKAEQARKKIAAEEAKVQRSTAGFYRRQDLLGETESVPTGEDPEVEARLYQSRAQQFRVYEAAMKAARRQGRVPLLGGPQGPSGPAVIPGTDPGSGGGGSAGGFTAPSGMNITRFLASAAGLGVGLSIYFFAGRLVHDVLRTITSEEEKAIQSTKNLAAAYGASAQTFSNLTRTLNTGGSGTGPFKVADIQNALVAIKPLQENFRLSEEQTQGLVRAAAKLADIHDIPLIDATNALGEALSGSSASADKLGLSLTDVQVAQQYANGAFAGAFDILTPAQQAAAKLAVAEEQIAEQGNNVVNQQKTWHQSIKDVEVGWEGLVNQFSKTNYKEIAAGIDTIAVALHHMATSSQEAREQDPATRAFWGKLAQSIGDFLSTPLELSTKKEASVRNAQKLAEAASKVGQVISKGPADIAALKREADKTLHHMASLESDLYPGAKQVGHMGTPFQEAQKAATAFFEHLKQDAPTIQKEITNIAGAVENISVLSPAQRAALATRQAEMGVLKERSLQATVAAKAQYAEEAGVKALQGAYDNLIAAQQQKNELQAKGVELAAEEARAQLKALPQTRAAQDLELRLQRDTLVGNDRMMSMEDRAAARRDAHWTKIALTHSQLQALDANMPVIAARRAQEGNTLNATIATGAVSQAQTTIDQAIAAGASAGAAAGTAAAQEKTDITITLEGGVSVSIDGANINLPDYVQEEIAQRVNGKFVEGLAAAASAVENRPSRTLPLSGAY